MQPDAPFNVKLLDVNAYIRSNRVAQVTSLSIHEPSSRTYAPTGLFSEQIFGPIGSPDRMVTFGYVQLNTKILQPLIYKNVVKLGALYEDILSGNAHAVFDRTTMNFVRVGDPDSHEDAGTGYTFFMSHFNEIEFERNDSRIRSDRIDIIEKYRDIVFCDKLLVLPAGLRDLEEDQGNITTDDINKLYQTLLSYSFSLPPGASSSIYDGVRFKIQQKAVEIYNYIENILTGKRGFIQGAWGQRRIALGTRNVITAATYATLTPNDPQAIQPDETKLGLFQTMKAIQPIVVHHVRTKFFDPVFGQDSNTLALTNPETFELEYREISNQELNRFDTTAAIESWISKFRNVDIRFNPVAITDTTGKQFYLCMVYDNGTEISLFRSLPEFVKSSAKKPLAVIVTGNPKYIEMPSIKPMADKFYGQIKQMLEARGFEVKFDPGAEYTSPDENAAVWIAHSRGIDRLQYAPPGVKTIALQTKDHVNQYNSHDERGIDPLHYQLSQQDIDAIDSLDGSLVAANVDKSKIRPLTWAEMFYMATYGASQGKHCFVTRYPVIQDESCYPSKVHLCTTMPARIVKLVRTIGDESALLTYPQYPILGKPFIDSVVLAASRLTGLGGDFDGDTVSVNVVMSDEANAELHEFLNSPRSILNSQKQLLIGAQDDLIGYTLRALSLD
jgi:hypothetical protein